MPSNRPNPVMLASYMGESFSMEIREGIHRVAGRLQLPQELMPLRGVNMSYQPANTCRSPGRDPDRRR